MHLILSTKVTPLTGATRVQRVRTLKAPEGPGSGGMFVLWIPCTTALGRGDSGFALVADCVQTRARTIPHCSHHVSMSQHRIEFPRPPGSPRPGCTITGLSLWGISLRTVLFRRLRAKSLPGLRGAAFTEKQGRQRWDLAGARHRSNCWRCH